jgi:hypothetical protein
MPSRFPLSPIWSWKLALVTALLASAGVAAYHVYRTGGQPSSIQTPEQGVSALVSSAAPTAPMNTAHRQRSPALTMDEKQRAFLWDIEHHGLLLSRFGFAALADALSRPDRPALTALLAAQFSGQVLEQPREVRVERGWLQVVRQEDAGRPPRNLDREAFLNRLLDYRQLFAQPPKVKLALMALAPVSHDKLEGPWQGTCQLRMWGKAQTASGVRGQGSEERSPTPELHSVLSTQYSVLSTESPSIPGPAGPAEVVLYLRYQLPQPTEANLRRGGWLKSCAITQSQISRAPRFLLREAAAERGLDPKRFHDNWTHGSRGSVTGGVYLCDFNRDGILDLLVVDVNGIALYQGLPGGKFRDVTLQVGLPWQLRDPTGTNLVAAFVDLDGDGWEDLILDRRIFRNEGGLRFTDVTHLSNLRLPDNVSGFAVADFDRDGRLDLYVARVGPASASSWLDGKCGGRAGNLLLRNRGNWQFDDVTAASGTGGGDRSTFSAVWLDANNDGWPDLYVTNEFGNGVLLINQGDGTFREQTLIDAPADFGSMGVTAGDIDNDGNIDLYVANMYSKAGNRVINNVAPGTYSTQIMSTMRSFVTGSELWHNRGVGGPGFERRGRKLQVADVGWAYGPALVDLDNDGWLDLYATAGFVSQDRNEPDG